MATHHAPKALRARNGDAGDAPCRRRGDVWRIDVVWPPATDADSCRHPVGGDVAQHCRTVEAREGESRLRIDVLRDLCIRETVLYDHTGRVVQAVPYIPAKCYAILTKPAAANPGTIHIKRGAGPSPIRPISTRAI